MTSRKYNYLNALLLTGLLVSCTLPAGDTASDVPFDLSIGEKSNEGTQGGYGYICEGVECRLSDSVHALF